MVRDWVCNTLANIIAHVQVSNKTIKREVVYVKIDFHVKSREYVFDCSFVIWYRITLEAIRNESYLKAKGIVWERSSRR